VTQICKGVCQRYEAPKKPNKLRYKNGEKKCGVCDRFFITDKWRCICCRATLRKKSHSHSTNKRQKLMQLENIDTQQQNIRY